MERVQTTYLTAAQILENGNRVIKATKGKGLYKVLSININNQTFILTGSKGHQLMQNCEDYIFYIQVPKNSKNVY